jgi:ankyrin repeat protein
MSIWNAAKAGDLAEVERLVGHDPGLLDARDVRFSWTPLMLASAEGHIGVVRLLLDKGAAINQWSDEGWTALWLASCHRRLPVLRLLLERGGDPAIADQSGTTPLIIASHHDHLEVVRVLLGHPSAKVTLNDRDHDGETALWVACNLGHAGVARALLEGGADSTITNNEGTTPMAVAKQQPPYPSISAEGRRECVAALEVRSFNVSHSPTPALSVSWLRSFPVAGGGAGLLAVEGPAGGRPAGERRGGGGGRGGEGG